MINITIKKWHLVAFIVVLFFFHGVMFTFAAWTGPTAAPPGNNASAPINVSTGDQVKNGGLSVNALAVFGNAILSGASRYFNFGLTAGSEGYGIRDNAGTIESKNVSGTWSPIFTAATGGVEISGGQYYTSSDTLVVPAGVTRIKVTAIGGGGAGGRCQQTYSAGGGGGGGAVVGYATVVPGASMPVTVGAGGIFPAGFGYGGNGGDSSFGTVIAQGGRGAPGGSACPVVGGAGGTGSGAAIIIPGTAGGPGNNTTYTGPGGVAHHILMGGTYGDGSYGVKNLSGVGVNANPGWVLLEW